MAEMISNFYRLASKLVSSPHRQLPDTPTRSPSDSPDTVYSIWLQFSRTSFTFQAAILLLVAFVLYRWVCLPFAQDFFLAERCRFNLQNTGPLKAGDDIFYTITGFLPTARLENNEIDEYTQRFFNSLIVKVMYNDERVPTMKAYADEDHGRIIVSFTVTKSGAYNVSMRYNGFLIPGCPFDVNIPPDTMSAENSEVKLPSIPVLLTDGMPQTIEIFPKDKTGFPCSPEGVRLDKFDFHASTEKSCCNVILCGKVCELIGGFWKEGLDASFSYGGSSVLHNRIGSQISICLNLRTNRSPNSYGMFEGQICYDGHLIKCFPIVSLTCDEYEKLEPTLKEPKPTDVIQLKGEILQPLCPALANKHPQGFMEWYMSKGTPAPDPLKEVHLNISLKFICIKEVVWTVLLSRTALFSIQGNTKIEAIPQTDKKDRYVVTISDDSGSEVRLLMYASSTRMLMALFLKFRAYATASEFCFTDKANNFLESLQTHCQNIMSFQRENFQLLNISRPDVLRTSYEESKSFDKAQWYSPFVVSFLREPLVEGDAAWLEWAELLLDTVLENNPHGMFHKISVKSGFIHPNPSRNYRRWGLYYYELAGKLMGKYLVERAMNTRSLNYRVKAQFSRSFLLQLIGSTPTANSLERDMPELYESTLRTLTKSNFDEGVLTFCVPMYDVCGKLDQMIPLLENGEQILVTNDNADMYLNALARYHLTDKVSREIAAFRAGFTFIVPEDLLLNFDENELELLICGWSKLDISELKKNHTVVGENWHPEFPRILKWFWTSLENMSPVEHGQFLQFSTGSSILPTGGFAQLNPRMHFSMTCLYGQLPTADPPSHSICFSDHPNYEAFDAALFNAMRRTACCQDRPNRLECVHETETEVDVIQPYSESGVADNTESIETEMNENTEIIQTEMNENNETIQTEINETTVNENTGINENSFNDNTEINDNKNEF